MSQLGEPVTIGMVDEEETKCPFDHELEPVEVPNNFVGDGQALGKLMAKPLSTFIYHDASKAGGQNCADLKTKFEPEFIALTPVLDPRIRSGNERVTDVTITFNERVTCEDGSPGFRQAGPFTYPVTCAAHHLIPAQDSLKSSQLLFWMCKKGEAQTFKNGKAKVKATYSLVWSNVGYDVNGYENGVFLPGNYAVGGAGSAHWDTTDDGDDEKPMILQSEVPLAELPKAFQTGAKVADDKPMLNGMVWVDASDTNPSWAYVRTAVDKCHGQFHDAHVDYNKFVRGVLRKIAGTYSERRIENMKFKGCSKCDDRAKKMEELGGIPPPYGVVTRLNKLSANLKTCLSGSVWRPNIYTSKWGKAYMDYLQYLKDFAL